MLVLQIYVYPGCPRYKPLMKHFSRFTGDEQHYAGTIAHAESSFLTRLIKKELDKMLSVNSAPNFMIDMVQPNAQEMERLTKSYKTNVVVASCHPILAVERAFDRGHSTGRYVPGEIVLSGHKQVSRIIEQTILSYPNIHFRFYNTDNIPIKIAEKEPGKELEISDKTAYQFFLDKKEIDIDAIGPFSVYPIFSFLEENIDSLFKEGHVFSAKISSDEISIQLESTKTPDNSNNYSCVDRAVCDFEQILSTLL